MIRLPALLLWSIVIVAAFSGLYMVKFRVQSIIVDVAVTERQLRAEKQNLHVLAAEWTYLNRPARLKQLSSKYLHLQSMQGSQIADMANLPTSSAAITAPRSTPSLAITPAALVHGEDDGE